MSTKKKRGRPLKQETPLEVQISIRLTDREAQNLAMYAWRHEMTMADVVRDALSVLSITGI